MSRTAFDASSANDLIKQQVNLIQGVISNINSMLVTPLSENYSPLLHTPLTVHEGISVTGNFLTTDTNGQMSYVTVLRQAEARTASDGVGFAWKVADGHLYNVYLVDSNPLVEDIMFSENYIIQNVGENAFLTAASGIITADTRYSFRLDIGMNYALDLWIWPKSLGGFNSGLPGMIHLVHGGFTPRSNGTHFGIAVTETLGAEWYYDDLQIASVNSLHTAALFELKADPAQFPNGTETTVKHYGYGMDGTTPGLEGFIWNAVAAEWEQFDEHDYDGTVGHDLAVLQYTFTMSDNYRDVDNFVRLCVTTPTSGVDVSEVTTYYVSLENTAPAGIHVGGKSDVYVYDPTKIMTGERTLSTPTGRINLTAAESIVLPIMNVAKIITAIGNEELEENVDWSLSSENVGNAYSTRDTAYLSISTEFCNRDLLIIYRYYANGISLQTLLDSAANRFIGTDSLAKIMPPAVVNIDNLVYSGPLTLVRAQELIKDYVINTKTVIVSEIVARLMAAGAAYVDTNTILITVNEYNEKREHVRVVTVVTNYTAPAMCGLFADEYSMPGLSKQ